MTAPVAIEQPAPARPALRFSRTGILIAGVFVIPIALNVVFNSWGPLTTESAIRMAFASVAGQTISILSAITVVILTVRRRYAFPAIVAVSVVALIIILSATSSMAGTGDLLLTRLDLVAEVDLLNR